jgi:hypothetical protein
MKLSAVILLAVLCGTAFTSMAQDSVVKLPGNANAMLTVEVAKLLNSPLGKQLSWQSKLIKGYAERPLPVPATASKLTIAAAVHPGEMSTIWEAAVIDLTAAPNFEPILRKQGGYLDQIAGKKAAWTPKDVFYVELGPKTLGVVRPGQRQYVTKWITGKTDSSLSAYLKQAQSSASGADLTLTVDLDDVTSATAIRYATRMGQLPSLVKIEETSPALLTALASVKGLRLTMRVGEKIDGEIVVDFEQPVAGLGDATKGFVTDVLTCADLYEPALDQWVFKSEGKTIVGKGNFAPEAIGRLVMLLSPAGIADASDAAPAAAETKGGEASDPKLDATTASQQYYKAIASILSGVSAKATPTDSGRWLITKARQIEQLPILNVDSSLVAWGNSVVDSLNRAAIELGSGQQKAKVAAAGVASPTGTTAYTEYGETTVDSPESRAAFRNAEQQRRQLAQTERGIAAERALAILQQAVSSQQKIRAEMVQKFGAEF